jgi:hypothetical protein
VGGEEKQRQACINQGGVGRDQRNADDDDGALVAFAKLLMRVSNSQ